MGFFSQAAAMPLPPAQAEAIYDLALDGERSRTSEFDFTEVDLDGQMVDEDRPWGRTNDSAPRKDASHLMVVSSKQSS